MDKFESIRYIMGDKSILNNYHFYEKYNGNKNYQKAPFQHNYGYGNYTYIYKLYIFNNEEKYVVADEQLDKKELDYLSVYCQCKKCTSSWYNISSYFICGCCIGCLKSQFPSQYHINKTREYLKYFNI